MLSHYFFCLFCCVFVSGNVHMKVPQTVTCHVLSSETLTTMSSTSSDKEYVKQSSDGSGKSTEINALESSKAGRGSTLCNQVTPLVLVGLHSCGDLSVNMLRWMTIFDILFWKWFLGWILDAGFIFMIFNSITYEWNLLFKIGINHLPCA